MVYTQLTPYDHSEMAGLLMISESLSRTSLTDLYEELSPYNAMISYIQGPEDPTTSTGLLESARHTVYTGNADVLSLVQLSGK